MAKNFNSYIDNIPVDFWKQLCTNEGRLRQYAKGEEFISAGHVGKYIGYIKTGTLKYVVWDEKGAEHVIGLEYAGEFVSDFPFSIYGQKSRVSIIATSPCKIYCVPSDHIARLMESDPKVREMIHMSSEALYSTIYDRYISLYTLTPQERYKKIVDLNPDIFDLFSLKDIASYLNITPTHLSRLRK